MEIYTSYNYHGKIVNLLYKDADNFDDLDPAKCTQVYAVAFIGEKMVAVHNCDKDTWGLPGGTIEPGEKFQDTLKRELIEEANIEVIDYWPIGYQVSLDEDIYQLRYACTARILGEFVKDPGGHVCERALFDPSKVKDYFDWGEIGDRLIERAQKLIR